MIILDISNCIIDMHATILQAMNQINLAHRGIVYICENGKLRGVLTDGDIRRFIIKGGNLDEAVDKVMNREPKVLYDDDREAANRLMKAAGINSIPVLDRDGIPVKIFFTEFKASEAKKNIDVPVVIMAGGKGTRLLPYTHILPKPLVPIGSKTITEHIMDRFIDYGCTQFYLIVNYKKNFIKTYFSETQYTQDICFVEEEQFLGTGGGMKLLSGRFQGTFFLTNCDILVDGNYEKMLQTHKNNNNFITIVGALKKMNLPYGTLDISNNGRVDQINEKPTLSFLTNTGLYILETELFKRIPANTFIHITDIIQACIHDGLRVGVYEISEDRWMDMGQFDELEKMRKKLENTDMNLE